MDEYQNIHTGEVVHIVNIERVVNIPPILVYELSDGGRWNIDEFRKNWRPYNTEAKVSHSQPSIKGDKMEAIREEDNVYYNKGGGYAMWFKHGIWKMMYCAMRFSLIGATSIRWEVSQDEADRIIQEWYTKSPSPQPD